MNPSAKPHFSSYSRTLAFFFLLSASSLPFLNATVNKPLCFDFFSGYRNDHLHWHLQDGGSGLLNYSEKYRDLQFWKNGLTLQVIHRDLAFFLQGSYSAFGHGSLSERYAGFADPASPFHFHFDTSGWAADTRGYFGYAVDLTPDRTYTVIIMPLAGYSAHFERIRAKRSQGETTFEMPQNPDVFFKSHLPEATRIACYGFFIGVNWIAEPGNRLTLSGGYSYHWLNERFRSSFSQTTFSLLDQTETFYSVKAQGNGNLGQTGWIQAEYLIDHAWKVGVGADIHYFSSCLLDAKVLKTAASETSFHQKLKVRWTPVSGWVTAGREF